MINYLGNDSEYKEAIADIAVENGLVTEHTSMVVMHNDQFAARGIERRNKQRRDNETAAQSTRASQPVQSSRVDSQQPAFNNKPRASYSGGNGGGALSFEILLLLPFILLAGMRRIKAR